MELLLHQDPQNTPRFPCWRKRKTINHYLCTIHFVVSSAKGARDQNTIYNRIRLT
uniref:Uncharacterized protein n=1 Tax=Arundo donax TaxID=35708 RepID=A0A0A9HT28_ARUDO